MINLLYNFSNVGNGSNTVNFSNISILMRRLKSGALGERLKVTCLSPI